MKITNNFIQSFSLICSIIEFLRSNPENPFQPRIAEGQKFCLNFVRSTCGSLDCRPGPKEQLNQITHWLDNSNVYGSTEDTALKLRKFQDGLLNFTIGNDGSEQLPFLPIDETHPLAELVGEGRSPFAGDARVFENPMLGAIHILFLREHNRIATELKAINPRWDDERLYQESRRILNAEYQHIIYNEWLPAILGNID